MTMDVYKRITDKSVADLEQGERLWAKAMKKNLSAPIWITFNQAKELCGQIRQGEHGSLVAYANTYTKTEHDEQTGEVGKIHPLYERLCRVQC